MHKDRFVNCHLKFDDTCSGSRNDSSIRVDKECDMTDCGDINQGRFEGCSYTSLLMVLDKCLASCTQRNYPRCGKCNLTRAYPTWNAVPHLSVFQRSRRWTPLEHQEIVCLQIARPPHILITTNPTLSPPAQASQCSVCPTISSRWASMEYFFAK